MIFLLFIYRLFCHVSRICYVGMFLYVFVVLVGVDISVYRSRLLVAFVM